MSGKWEIEGERQVLMRERTMAVAGPNLKRFNDLRIRAYSYSLVDSGFALPGSTEESTSSVLCCAPCSLPSSISSQDRSASDNSCMNESVSLGIE